MAQSDIEGQTEVGQPSLLQHAAKFGAIIGAIMVFLTVILYVVSISFMVSLKFLFLLMCIGLGMLIYSGINYRNEVGGFLSYKNAFLHGLVALGVAGAISTIFNIVLHTVVDPDLANKMTEAILTNTEEMMRNFGAPEGSIDQTLSETRAKMAEQFTVGGILFGYVKAYIGYVIISLITALFVRKNVPVEI